MSRQPPFHLLPSIDSLLRLQEDVPGALAKQAATLLVVGLKQRISNDWPPSEGEAAFLGEDALRQRLERIRADLLLPFHRRAVNATGILLHTGLGRAPLPEAAIRAITEVAGQGLVEVEAESGRRGRRETAVAELCCALTGAEAALVVNNNAAATLFGLDVLARGREVPVSRGELVEIGGGFRMPEVMERAGCRLVEVGATNRSRLQDYERAINENTGCLLKVHPSNFRIEGFTEEVPLLELVALGKRHGLPVFEDLGSGYLLADPLPHDSREPSVPASVASGADLISFSGDKLLGSCQAGILVGKRETIERLASHPLYRALRLSKLALSALEATLLIYRFGEPKQEIPVLRSIFAGSKAIRSRGKTFSSRARKVVEQLGYELELVESLAYVGSGASPARSMPSFSLCLSPRKSALSVEELARQLRVGTPSIWARIVEDSLLLDMRSPAPGEEKLILARLGEIAGVDGAKLTFETTEQAES